MADDADEKETAIQGQDSQVVHINAIFNECDAMSDEKEALRVMTSHLVRRSELMPSVISSLTTVQKEELQRGIACLDSDHFDPLIDMLQSFIPAGEDNEDEVELDVDKIPSELQVKMYNYMLQAVKQQEASRQDRQGANANSSAMVELPSQPQIQPQQQSTGMVVEEAQVHASAEEAALEEEQKESEEKSRTPPKITNSTEKSRYIVGAMGCTLMEHMYLCECFASEIYGDRSKYHQVAQEMFEYQHRVTSEILFGIGVEIHVLAEWFNVNLEVYEFDEDTDQIVWLLGVDTKCQEIPTVSLLKRGLKFAVMRDSNSKHKPPYRSAVQRLIVANRMSIKIVNVRDLNLAGGLLTSQQLKRQEEDLRQMRGQVQFLDGTASNDKWNRLDLQKLNLLEAKTRAGMDRIQKTRCRVLERKFSCIVCLDKPKNILINRCNHFVLCQDCELKLEIKDGYKVCPLCQKKYKSINKVYI